MIEFRRLLPKEHHILHVTQRFIYFAFLRWVRYLFSVKIIRHEYHNGKLDKPLVIVSNHISNWDPFLILSSLGERLYFNNILWRFPAYHGHFKIIHKKIFYKIVGAFPIKREESLEKSMETSIEMIKKGNSMLFFPEGKRVIMHEKAKIGRGIEYLLKQTSFYILPVNVSYLNRGKRGLGARLGKAEIVFGKVIESDYFIKNFSDDSRHIAVMDHIRNLVK